MREAINPRDAEPYALKQKSSSVSAQAEMHHRVNQNVQAAGVDAIGFNCWIWSPHYLGGRTSGLAGGELPPSILPVGVFVKASPDEVARAVEVAGFRAIQLHGDEDAQLYASIPAEIIQVIRMTDAAGLPTQAASRVVRRVLLDAHVDGYGGAGKSFDWKLVPEAKRRLQREVMVGGGLTADNVADAIRMGQPWGVDVASGVESSPGVKDRLKLIAFVAAVRAADGSA